MTKKYRVYTGSTQEIEDKLLQIQHQCAPFETPVVTHMSATDNTVTIIVTKKRTDGGRN
jgi:hypothetical protein